MVIQKPQSEFPLLEEYKKVFAVTPKTIFAYDNCIYSDDNLPDHLIIHEQTHIKQQNEIGLYKWVEQYLTNVDFRLKIEVEAYRNQISSIKDRNLKTKVRIQSAKDLSSDLYGGIITFYEALNKLK